MLKDVQIIFQIHQKVVKLIKQSIKLNLGIQTFFVQKTYSERTHKKIQNFLKVTTFLRVVPYCLLMPRWLCPRLQKIEHLYCNKTAARCCRCRVHLIFI
jgi:hypothetical protein